MNPLTNVKNLQKINQRELELGIVGKKSWHDQYKDSAWVFIGGLPYDLTEGDVVCVFSQYGEIVNINLVRDKQTGKTKGFGFLCYEDQRSTVLAVDNLNGFKLCGRTLRVDHVSEYKLPKELQDADEVTKKIRAEGIAPRTPSPEPEEEEELEETYVIPVKKIKKEKKSKKEKKRKKKKQSSSESSSDSESEDNKLKLKVEKVKVKQEKEDDGYNLSASKSHNNGYQRRKAEKTNNVQESNGHIKRENISCERNDYKDERRGGDRYSETDRRERDRSGNSDRLSDRYIQHDKRQSERNKDHENSRSSEKRHQYSDRHSEYDNDRYSRRHDRKEIDTDSYGRDRYDRGRADRHRGYKDRYH